MNETTATPSPERGAIRRVVCAVREAQDTHNVMAVMLSANTVAAESELAALEAQNAALRVDAGRWRAIADKMFVGTDEDGELYMCYGAGHPDDCNWLGDAEVRFFEGDSLNPSEMPRYAERIADAAIDAARVSADANNGSGE